MAAVFGHMFPVFAGFKGGKGQPLPAECFLVSSLLLAFRLHFLDSLFDHQVCFIASIVSTAIAITLLIMRYGLDRYVDGSIIIIAA